MRYKTFAFDFLKSIIRNTGFNRIGENHTKVHKASHRQMFHLNSKSHICHKWILQVISHQIKDNVHNHHGSIGLVLETIFGGETLLWVFWPFPFLFLLSVGRKSHRHKRFWLVIKKGTTSCVTSHGFLSFLSCLWQSCMFIQTLSGPKTFLYIFFCFLLISIGNFLFLLLSFDLWPGTFFFFCFLPIFDQEFSFFSFFFWSTFAA